ncbi:FtsB family cell division protein [Actinomadura rubrisoli]|uniref:FtsB family cell division protein n=1 Tax=Actinomadura rubrisoli TaxID=2530368 RepID=UPI001A9FE7B0|nr:hypothetical protein [Actinomadura rubrisoli]
MTTTTRRPPGSAPQPRARPDRKTGERSRGSGDDAPAKAPKKKAPERPGAPSGSAVPAREAEPKPNAPTTGAPKTGKGPGKGKPPGRPASGKGASATTTTAKPARGAGTAAPKGAPAKDAKAAPAKGRPARARKERQSVVQAPPRAPFVLLIMGLLGGALVSLLLLNTVLAKDAFTLTRLQQSNKMLEQQRQAYQEEIAREDSPASLDRKARALGLKPREGVAFVDSDTGRTTGGTIRPVPHSAAASAGAASVLGIPGTVVPGDGVPQAAAARPPARGNGTPGQGTGAPASGARQGTGAP